MSHLVIPRVPSVPYHSAVPHVSRPAVNTPLLNVKYFPGLTHQ